MHLIRTTITMMVLLTSLFVPLAAWGLAQGYPDIFMDASPSTKNVPVGGSATVKVSVIGQETFEGLVQLTAENVPAGLTVTFNPNIVDVPFASQVDANMTISSTSDALIGSSTLRIVGTSKEQLDLQEGHTYVKKSIPFIITITSPTTTTTTNSTTTTSTSTSQTSTTSTPTTSTTTSTEAEQGADYTLPILVAVAVIVIASVAAVVLRRRK